MKKPRRRSWVMHLPRGLREQPAWVFIGTLSAASGASYLLGISSSSAVSSVLETGWLQAWGAFLAFSGSLVVGATVATNRPLERLSLRLLSVGFLVYLGWVLTAIPPTRAMVTVVSCVSLIGMAEIRVAILKAAMRPPPIIFERKRGVER